MPLVPSVAPEKRQARAGLASARRHRYEKSFVAFYYFQISDDEAVVKYNRSICFKSAAIFLGWVNLNFSNFHVHNP